MGSGELVLNSKEAEVTLAMTAPIFFLSLRWNCKWIIARFVKSEYLASFAKDTRFMLVIGRPRIRESTMTLTFAR